jgi:hypothetical protein
MIRRLILIAALLAAGPAAAATVAGSQTQFPTAPWGGYAPAKIECGELLKANMNVTTDQAIPISVPSVNYYVGQILISNPSVSLTTASGGFYTAVSKGGTTISSNAALSTLTAAAVNSAGSVYSPTIASTSTILNLATIYFSLSTAQGVAATADIRVFCDPLF